MDVTLIKTMNGFMPYDPQSGEWAEKIKAGQVIRGKFTKMRNAAFHRKFFALLNLAYEYWEPGEIDSKYGKPEKNFERFRKDLTILAGYYDTVINIKGEVRVEAKSISFASMDNDEFEKLYNAVLDVVLKRIPVLSEMGREKVKELTEKFMEFA